jgi:HAD superfamily hydrolase (TIGR01509 family)
MDRNIENIKLMVFDLDGTIIDSEWAHESAKKTIYTQLGVKEDIDLAFFTGRSNRFFWETILDRFDLRGDVDDLVRRQFEIVMWELKNAHQLESPGLSSLLNELKSHGIKMAVSSGSEEYFIKDMLNYLRIMNFFDFIITGNDIANLKPSPDIYLASLSKSGIHADYAVAVEDSFAGCQAVKSAGLCCIGYTKGGKNPQDLKKADYTINDFFELIELLFGK